jgi:predicted dehydrogenase
MGNQGSAEDGLRRAVEVIQAGKLGPVHEVYVWSNRPIWPQGVLDAWKDGKEPAPLPEQPIPAGFKWDLWLAAAPARAYNEAYCPFKWRGWWDFGTGALGDMACHTSNLPFRALKLEYPVKIEATSAGINSQTYPAWSQITFDFPARGSLPPIKFHWSDGGKKVPTELVEGLDLTSVTGGKKKKKVEKLSPGDIPGSGCLIVGEKAKLFSPDDYGSAFKIFPEVDYADVSETLPRVHGTDGHYKEWIDAIKGGPPAYSNFDFAALLTETILLGNIALRVGKPMEWDGPNMKSPNCPEAAKYIETEYRKGYTL